MDECCSPLPIMEGEVVYKITQVPADRGNTHLHFSCHCIVFLQKKMTRIHYDSTICKHSTIKHKPSSIPRVDHIQSKLFQALGNWPHVYNGVQTFCSSLNTTVIGWADATHISVLIASVFACLFQNNGIGSWGYAHMDSNLFTRQTGYGKEPILVSMSF